MDETRARLKVLQIIRHDGTIILAYKDGGFVGTVDPAEIGNVVVTATVHSQHVHEVLKLVPQNKPRKHRKRALLGLE